MRDTQSQGADDLRARLEEAERDGAKLQGFNQRLAARVAELEKQQEAGKAPACHDTPLYPPGCCTSCGVMHPEHIGHKEECPQSTGQVSACECPTRRMLKRVWAQMAAWREMSRVSFIETEWSRQFEIDYSTALSAPCPYAELRAELAELRAEHESAGKRWAKAFIENDALRAELAQRDAKIAGLRRAITLGAADNHRRNVELDALHYVWCDGGCEGGIHRFGEHPPLTQEIVEAAVQNTRRLVRKFNNVEDRKLSNAEIKTRWESQQAIEAENDSLRAKVETLEAALTQIRALDYANAAVNCAAYEAVQIADAALKEGK